MRRRPPMRRSPPRHRRGSPGSRRRRRCGGTRCSAPPTPSGGNVSASGRPSDRSYWRRQKPPWITTATGHGPGPSGTVSSANWAGWSPYRVVCIPQLHVRTCSLATSRPAWRRCSSGSRPARPPRRRRRTSPPAAPPRAAVSRVCGPPASAYCRRVVDRSSVLSGLDAVPRSRLATLPTPLERGPGLPGGARLWVKRDDLTGLGRRWQQGPQAGVPLRRGARSRRPVARHGRRRPVEPLPDDRGCGRRAGPRGPPRAVGHPSGPLDRQPAAGRALRCAAALRRVPAAPLGRAGDRPRAAHGRAGRGRRRPLRHPDRREHGDRCPGLPRRLRGAGGPVRRPRRRADRRRPHVVERRHARRRGGRPGPAALARPDRAARGAGDRCRQGCRHGLAGHQGAGRSRARTDRCRRRSSSRTTTCRSTPAGWAPTTPSRPPPAPRRSGGAPSTAGGCWTTPTAARASPACSATPPPGGGNRAATSIFLHTGGLPGVFAAPNGTR